MVGTSAVPDRVRGGSQNSSCQLNICQRLRVVSCLSRFETDLLLTYYLLLISMTNSVRMLFRGFSRAILDLDIQSIYCLKCCVYLPVYVGYTETSVPS